MSDTINVIIPHFNTYPLQSYKMVSYYLFNVVTTIMRNNDHAIVKCFIEKYSHIKLRKKKGLYATIFKVKEFSYIIPFDTSNIVVKPLYLYPLVVYLLFVFFLLLANSKWPNYDATFSIAQNKRDV